jgi:hypothetical protein
MRRFKIAAAFAGITAGLVTIFGAVSPGASAAPASVCQTGHRGQPAYDRACLHTGKEADGGAAWVSIGKDSRRAVCKGGNVRAKAIDAVTDVTYDRYRNYKQVSGWAADMAQGECLRKGYADAVSGLSATNLHKLPKGTCWVETYYVNHKRAIQRETICKG